MVREEVNWWWNTAKKNLRRAQDTYIGKDYEASTFWSHQTIEYSFKAAILHSGNLPDKSHNLHALHESIQTFISISESERQLLLELGPYYSLSRYPDIYGGEPKVHAGTSKRFLNFAETLHKKIETFIIHRAPRNEGNALSKTKSNRTALVTDYVKKLSSVIRIEKAFIFGSTARNEALVNSDIDIVIVSPDFEGKTIDSRIRTAYPLWKYNLPADITLLTAREMKSRLKQSVALRDASKYWKPLPLK